MTRNDMIKKLPYDTTGVEVGVLEGCFSEEILTTPVKKLFLIDSWTHQEEGYTDPANVGQLQQDHRYHLVYEKFKHDSRVEIIRDWSISDKVKHVLTNDLPDWVYIDANHTHEAALNDLIFYSRITNHIFMHDYVDNEKSRSMNFGVIKAVNDFMQDNPDWIILNISDEEWPTVELIKNVT